MGSDNILVSVCVITYDHEDFISHALESILNQETNFNIEVIIGEDTSKDQTRSICKRYQKEYAKKIQLLPSDGNLGIQSNFFRTLNACNSKYIAICEGDDYWTDKNKLQLQIDFLEQHSEYSACAHQANVIYEDQEKPSHPFNQIVVEQDFNTKDLIGLRKFHTASVVFRSDILKKQPYLPTSITASDRALFFLLASYGPIKFFPEIMCVYRKSNTGISSWVTHDMLKKDFNIIPWITKHNPDFPRRKYRAYIHRTIYQYPQKNNLKIFIKHYLLFIWHSFSYFPANLKEIKASLNTFHP